MTNTKRRIYLNIECFKNSHTYFSMKIKNIRENPSATTENWSAILWMHCLSFSVAPKPKFRVENTPITQGQGQGHSQRKCGFVDGCFQLHLFVAQNRWTDSQVQRSNVKNWFSVFTSWLLCCVNLSFTIRMFQPLEKIRTSMMHYLQRSCMSQDEVLAFWRYVEFISFGFQLQVL